MSIRFNATKIIIIVLILSFLLFSLQQYVLYSISLHYFSILKKYFIHPWFNNIFDYMILNVSFLRRIRR